jgi:hypothetical protein
MAFFPDFSQSEGKAKFRLLIIEDRAELGDASLRKPPF